MDELHKLALETIKMNKQALIFAPSRPSAEKAAEDISLLTNISLPELEKEILKAASTPTKQCRRLSHCVRKGIAFHHAGLLQKQKDLIEDGFREGTIKIICCTPTLAAGMSLPAFRVIIKSLKRFSGGWGNEWIPVLEYLQMAGRAGRPEYESFGEAIVIAKDEAEKEDIYERYICGEPEEIYSKLAVEPVLRTYLLSLISSGIIRDEKSMREFFARTFWAHQFKDSNKLEAIMQSMLKLLEEWEFVKISREGGDEFRSNFNDDFKDGFKNDSKDDFVTASKLNADRLNTEKKLRPTVIGKKISELYLDPLTAKHLLDCLINFKNNSQSYAFSLLQMISHTLEMRPLLRVKSREQDRMQDALVKNYAFLLEPEPSAYDLEYDEFINSIKTALFFEAWIDEKDEDYLLETFDIRPGEIRVKLNIADWLLYSAEELAKINSQNEAVKGTIARSEAMNEAVKEIRKLRLRIKHGAKEELLPLLRLRGIGRIRARKLYSHGIKDLGDVKSKDITTLAQLLGKTLAENVKQQVDQEVKEVPKGRRIGQLSLNKY